MATYTYIDSVKKGWKKLKEWALPPRSEVEFQPEPGETPPPPPRKAAAPESRRDDWQESRIPYGDDRHEQAPDNVVPFPGQRERTAAPAPASAELFLYYAQDRGDCEAVIDMLLKGRIIALNVAGMSSMECQRVIDLIGGAAFSLRARVEPLSPRNYLITPAGVSVDRNANAPQSDADVWHADDHRGPYDRRDPRDAYDHRNSYGTYGADDSYPRNRRYGGR
ncbi:MAG: cell division protein SepF [Oscillospiraceae bacterium]|jgi:cell division inhibitor SepF|nr:cell division protein SepF [Oscillospiraceae bacterium]